MAIVKVVPAALAGDIYTCCQGLGDFSVLAVVPNPLVSVHMSVTIHSAIEKHLVFIVTKKKKTWKIFSFFHGLRVLMLLSKAYMSILFQNKML